jgi:hypothetical protein
MPVLRSVPPAGRTTDPGKPDIAGAVAAPSYWFVVAEAPINAQIAQEGEII